MRYTSVPFAAILVALILASSIIPVNARTWHVFVDGSGDAPTIPAAVDSVANGDSILVAPGTYTWSNQGHSDDFGMIYIPRGIENITLASVAGAGATILDAQQQGRVMFIAGFNYMTIDGFTIKGGKAPLFGDEAGGGIAAHLTYDTVKNCIVRNNSAVFGGGLWCGGVSSMTIENCQFYNNTADHGAGMFFINSSLNPDINNCTIRNNIATQRAGAIYALNNGLTVSMCTIVDNEAGTTGGAGYFDRSENVDFFSCTVARNSAPSTAGFYVTASSIVAFDKCIVAYNGNTPFGLNNAALTVECSLYYGAAGPVGLPAGTVDGGGNVTGSPQFCGATGSMNFTLQSDSPALPENRPGGEACLVMGAFGPGCATVAVQERTWGSVKSLYR